MHNEQKAHDAEQHQLNLWFAIDGQTFRYVALDRRAAQTFADTANRHLEGQAAQIRVERRTAYVK